MTQSIDNIVEVYNNMVADMQSQMQTAMKKLFKVFFEENPEIKLIVWTQYTPYFNDGEECTFSVRDMMYSIEEMKNEDISSPYDLETDEYYERKKTPLGTNFSQFTNAINRLPDDVFKAMFGDHVIVYARPTGFDVEEYSHD